MKTNILRTLIFIPALLAGLMLPAQETDREAVLSFARQEIDMLCSDEFAGRGYIDDGHQIAADYIAQRFMQMGLKPVAKDPGGRETWLQEFDMEINLVKEVSLKLNGELQEPGADYIINGSSGSGRGKYKACDQGYGLKAKNSRGKVAVFTDGLPPEIQKDKEQRKAYKDKRSVMSKIDILGKRSPVAYLVRKKKLTVTFSKQGIEYPIIEVVADSMPKKLKTVSYDIKAEKTRLSTQNVMGMIEGTTYPDSFIVITGHYDHMGKQGSAIFAGANDNASGISMILSMADYYSKNKPKCSMLFIAFGGEETGLIGSRYYVQEDPVVPLSKMKFLLNLDLMGNGDEGMTAVAGYEFPAFFDKLVALNEEVKAVPKVKMRKNASNSDHYFFVKEGVPAFFIYTMGGPPHYHDIYDNKDTILLTKFVEIRDLFIKYLDQL